jgi:hypothetical protein
MYICMAAMYIYMAVMYICMAVMYIYTVSIYICMAVMYIYMADMYIYMMSMYIYMMSMYIYMVAMYIYMVALLICLDIDTKRYLIWCILNKSKYLAQQLMYIFCNTMSCYIKCLTVNNIILLSYKRLSQAELNTFATTVGQKMTDNVQFAPFKNYVEELKATNYLFAVALANAKRGSQEQVAVKNDCLTTVIRCLDRLAHEVNGLADGDTKIGLASGFDVVKSTPTVVTDISMPTNLTVRNAEATGTLKLTWTGNAAAVNYGIEYQVKGEEIWRNGTYSTSQSALLSGLPSGEVVAVKVRGLGRKQMKSEWTEPVSMIVV